MSFEVLKDALLDSKCDDVMVWVQNPYYQDEASSVKVDYIEDNNGNTFLPGSWYSLDGDPHDPENWKYLGTY